LTRGIKCKEHRRNDNKPPNLRAAETLDNVFALADRNVVLTKGEIVFGGPTAELKADAAFIQHHLGV
jgi:ABC-type branched-subunit amino acid transport system ATPase component